MDSVTYKFNTAATRLYFDTPFSQLKKIASPASAVMVTDENVYSKNEKKFKGWNTIVLKPGENYKVQATVDTLIEQMISLKADRKTTLIGVGGGVITDITGYAASVYMRGIPFGFVPTSVLALVDASIGGKNGIDVGVYKNMVGTIRQPSFLLHDYSFLKTLPQNEWENGFAEIIKHACIKDATLFRELEAASIKTYQQKKSLLSALVRRNALIKIRVVQKDEFEKGDRRLLNFGHTLGHALENQYELSHGQAVAIGMTYACHISALLTGFKDTERVVKLLTRYGLPTYAAFDKKKVMDVLKMDKKRERKEMNYVLLEKTGKAVIKALPVTQLEKIITAL
ncbi:MAG: 3-dehydroquinate synthase [Chitinophagaceae bacterium]|nr:3-dehydroquinate synthase [Chitinophagaceae bacterium]